MRQMLPASHPTCVNISGQTAAALNRRTVLSTTELPRRFRPPGWNSTARAHPTLAASLKLSTGAGFRPGCSLPAALPSTASIRAASHRPPTTPLRTPTPRAAAHVPCMPSASQHRVPDGSRDGGRFAPAAHTEPDVELPAADPTGDTATSRFATAGRHGNPQRRHTGTTLRTSANAAGPCRTFAGSSSGIWSW